MSPSSNSSQYPPTTPPSGHFLDPHIIGTGPSNYHHKPGHAAEDDQRMETCQETQTGNLNGTTTGLNTYAYPVGGYQTQSRCSLPSISTFNLQPTHVINPTYTPPTSTQVKLPQLPFLIQRAGLAYNSTQIPNRWGGFSYHSSPRQPIIDNPYHSQLQSNDSHLSEPPPVDSSVEVVDVGTPDLDSDRTDSPPRVQPRKMDMNMAVAGSIASQPGFHTPLAAYAAQTVTWLWFGTPTPSRDPHSASPLLSSPNPFDTSPAAKSVLNPLQVTPSAEFTAFVAKMLQITMVSHSVTLIALLYIYRLKQRNKINGEPGSEQRPFIASLILGNKYLDDNTYTNQTWSELTGLPIDDINRMEAEFLRGLDYRLGVQVEEYNQWRVLLDGFIFARQREAMEIASLQPRTRSLESPHIPYTPGQAAFNQPFTATAGFVPVQYPSHPYTARARSVSPQAFSPPQSQKIYPPGYVPTSPGLARKRSAIDAFSTEVSQSGIYEQMRQPTRKAIFAAQQSFGGFAAPGPSDIASRPSPQQRRISGGLGRSSSLNRRYARLPDAGRRGSFGHIYSNSAGSLDGMGVEVQTPPRPDGAYYPISLQHTPAEGVVYPNPAIGMQPLSAFPPELSGAYTPSSGLAMSGMGTPEGDLRHAAAIGWANQEGWLDQGWSALAAPYDAGSAQLVPPEHLTFYSLAAEAHPGQDGAPRKAILRYQYPTQPYPMPIPTGYSQEAAQLGGLIPQAYGTFPPSVEPPPIPPFGAEHQSHAQVQPQLLPSVPMQDVNMQQNPYHAYLQQYAFPHALQPVPAGQQTPIKVEPQPTPSFDSGSNPMNTVPVYPEFAQFANAGPPGYTYDPSTNTAWGPSVPVAFYNVAPNQISAPMQEIKTEPQEEMTYASEERKPNYEDDSMNGYTTGSEAVPASYVNWSQAALDRSRSAWNSPYAHPREQW